jgi:hypothetical protein
MTTFCETCTHLINESRMGTLNQSSDILLTSACMRGHRIAKTPDTNQVIYRGADCSDYSGKK